MSMAYFWQTLRLKLYFFHSAVLMFANQCFFLSQFPPLHSAHVTCAVSKFNITVKYMVQNTGRVNYAYICMFNISINMYKTQYKELESNM